MERWVVCAGVPDVGLLTLDHFARVVREVADSARWEQRRLPVLADADTGHLVLVPKPDFRPHGDFELRDGKVQNSTTPTLSYGGFALYRPEFFRHCSAGRFSVVPLMRAAADEGRLAGSIYDGPWQDVGTPERLEQLNRSRR